MPRPIAGAAAVEVGTRLGTEPIVVIGIKWIRNGPTFFYADKDIEGAAGKILQVSGLDSIIKLKSGGSTGSVSIKLTDEDFEIKDILDGHDIHQREATVYQTYPDLGLAGKFRLFEGVVSTPINWNEGDATVDFQIQNKIEDAEIGFSLEEGQFPEMADSAVGKAWPLCCGSPIRVPAVKVVEKRRGTNLTRYSIITRTEADELCAKATAYASTLVAKENFLADEEAKEPEDRLEDPEYTERLTNLINAITVAYVDLLNFEENLINNSPNLEDTITEFQEKCVEDAQLTLQIQRKQLEQEQQAAVIAVVQGNLEAIDFEIARLFQIVNAQGEDPNPADVEAYNDAVLQKLQLEADLATEQNKQTTLLQELNDLRDQQEGLAEEIAELREQLIRFTLEEMLIDDGEKFPQGEEIDIIVQGLRLRGTFDNRTFTITKTNLPTFEDVELAARQKETPNLLWIEDTAVRIKGHYLLLQQFGGADKPLYYVVYVQSQGTTRCAYSPVIWEAIPAEPNPKDFQFFLPTEVNCRIVQTSPIFLPQWDEFVGEDAHLNGVTNLPDNDWAIDVGDEVYLADDYQDKWVANLLPSASVHEVMAYRTLNGEEILQPVPISYYTVNFADSIAGQSPTTITLKRPLKEYVGEQWKDQLYVSLTSSEGPNTAEFIEYLIDTYSDTLTPDAASFASVAASLTNYPSHFAILKRQNLLQTIEDMAWQARCAIYVRDSSVFIKYLSQKGVPITSISESDVDFASMKIAFGESAELVTRLVAKWKTEYTQEDEHELVLRNNILKYGDFEREFDFWIYNIAGLVEKSAHFWLLRYSNTWKRLQLTTPIHKLALEVWDTVRLDFALPWIANAPVDSVVEGGSYESGQQMISFDIWVPVRQGEMTEYPLAYPASAPKGTLYPTPTDVFAGGFANGEDVQAQAAFDDATRPRDLGPKLPADGDDSLPINPADGREELEYNIPDQRDDGGGTGISEIDIRTTSVVDSLNPGTSVTLDTAFSIDEDEEGDARLMINTDARVRGLDDAAVIQTAPFDYRHDESGNWLPRRTFLAEEDPVIDPDA